MLRKTLKLFIFCSIFLILATPQAIASCQTYHYSSKPQTPLVKCSTSKKAGKSTFLTFHNDKAPVSAQDKTAPNNNIVAPNTDNDSQTGDDNNAPDNDSSSDNGDEDVAAPDEDPEDKDKDKDEDKFRVVLQTRYANMPDDKAIKDMGFDQVKLLTSWFFYPRSELKPKLDDTIRAHIRRNAERHMEDGKEYVLDIESLPIYMNATPQEREDSIQQLIEIMEIIRSVRPSVKLGYYAFPIRQYWMVYENCAWNHYRHDLCTEKQQEWHDANTQLLPLMKASDFIAPSLYTFYDKPDGWVNYAQANLKEAKRLSTLAGGKPIYAYLWPRYHGSNRELGYKLIDPAFWRMQLELVASNQIDGIIIWDHWPHRDFSKVKNEDPWFEQTLDFMGLPQK